MKFNSPLLFRLAAIALLARGVSAQAQTATNNPPVRLPEQVITAEREKEPSLTVPSAAQAKEALRAVPGGASVIQAEEFRTGRASTLKDVLEYAPGVFVQPRFGADESKISIRGSGGNRITPERGLKILQDGAPLNLADGTADVQSIEPLSVSYVEVLRGANALKYGGTTLGGAINYVTPTGYTADKLQLRGEYGSYGYARAQASSGQVLGPVDYYLSLTDGTQDGFRAHSRQSDQRVFSNLGWRISDTVETRFYYTYTLADMLLPGAIKKAQLEANPRQADPASVTGDRQRDFEMHRVANKTSIALGGGELTVNTFWSHKDYFHPFTTITDENSNDLGLDAQWEHKGELFGRPNDFVAGLGSVGGWVDNSTFVNNAASRGALLTQSYRNAENFDFYVQDRHWLSEKLSLVAGAQFSWANRDVQGVFAAPGNVSPTFNQDFWSVNPKAGFIFEQTDKIQYYGNVSRSFEPPSFGDMGNVALSGVSTFVPREAQSAWTVELGTRGEHGRWSWDVTGYHAWVDNELLSLALPGGVANGSVNASTTVHMGIEAGMGLRVWEDLTTGGKTGAEADAVVMRATYLWSRFRFQDDGVFGNNAIAGIPEHYLRMEMLYQHPCGFYFGPNIEWVATKSPIDHANTFYVDPYALVGIKAGYRSAKGVSGFVEVRNLTDKRYAATTGAINTAVGVDQAQFFPGDGRSIYLGLEWKF